MAFDLIIRGGDVFDGRGAPPRRADVGVREGRIADLGDLGQAQAEQEVDAGGLAVAPGFIDTHTHSDLVWALGPEHEDVAAGTILQGVTTEICGNCGFTSYPCVPEHRADLARHSGILGSGTPDWTDLAGFARHARAAGHFANLGPLVGHGSVRVGVMGFEDRTPRAEELATMRRLVEEAFEQGALGLSTGLIYMPGVYARTEELIDLATTVRRYRRPYVSHIRGEAGGVMGAVEEAIRIGREAGIPAHISHHKAAGRPNWGRTNDTLRLVDRVRAEGSDVTLDMYPYTAGSTLLHALLPPWAQEGGAAGIIGRLEERETRRRILEEVEESFLGASNGLGLSGWEEVAISTAPEHPETEAHLVTELAGAAGRPVGEWVLDLIAAEGCQATMIVYTMGEEDVRRVISHPAATIGSDGIPLPGKPHPRWAGTFARVMGHYARELRTLELATAVKKATHDAAQRFGLRDRGILEVGKWADVVVFDPAAIADRATYADPLLPPAGVPHVIVNGVVAVREGRLTGARPGTVLLAS
ncbi:MAG: D-aminoacylase [Candidatus Dormibacteraeota bacterium]|nr:D-aminoacylase [Candidatus Dormibacteraeota bacterium]